MLHTGNLLALFACIALSRVAANDCVSSMFEGQCYWYGDEKKSWHDAWLSCISDGGSLALAKDQKTYDFMKREALLPMPTNLIIGQEDVWIGLTDGAVRGLHRWVDGTALSTFNKWASFQPSYIHPEKNCVAYKTDGNRKINWWDYDCEKKKHFMCQSVEQFCEPSDSECAPWVKNDLVLKPGERLHDAKAKVLFEIVGFSIEHCVHLCKWAIHVVCLGVDYSRNGEGKCRFTGLSFEELKVRGLVASENSADKLFLRDRLYSSYDFAGVTVSPMISNVGDNNYDWLVSTAKCKAKREQQLVIIESEVKNWQLGNDATWIMLTDKGFKGAWHWKMGLDKIYPDYTNWADGHPNNKDDDVHSCAYRQRNGKWIALKCSDNKPFFCQKKCANEAKPVHHFQFADGTIITA